MEGGHGMASEAERSKLLRDFGHACHLLLGSGDERNQVTIVGAPQLAEVRRLLGRIHAHGLSDGKGRNFDVFRNLVSAADAAVASSRGLLSPQDVVPHEQWEALVQAQEPADEVGGTALGWRPGDGSFLNESNEAT